ncbi:SRPBCC domain-containing protein [Streptomyces polyrhachis]|uniref:SRPBCC domain-containing protein n=1 Tax=Streptomyces polyrhachis TaxID=1282885 RepID=A0ABW2GDA1_9ACTN
MEPLPYVDDQDRVIHASPEQVWPALLATARANGTSPPGPIARAMRLAPAVRGGDWSLPQVGDSVPGFQVTAIEPLRRVELRGGHRFSTYRLDFTLDDLDGHVRLHATTWAAFPGVGGRIYRALVIGSGGHRMIVGRMLRDVEQRVAA